MLTRLNTVWLYRLVWLVLLLPAISSLADETRLPPRIIREVVELSDYELIPKWIFERYDSRSIAESIAYRVHIKDEQRLAVPYDDLKFDWDREADIMLHFNMSDFDSILARGFLNQHQTGKTGGSYDPQKRAMIEDNLMGLKVEPTYNGDFSNSAHIYRPKYALLGFHSEQDLGERNSTGPASYYGQVVAVMKPEVKRRATWTYEDSLNVGCASKPLREIRQDIQGTFYRSSIRSHEHRHYSEAQIYGAADFRDVAYLLVSSGLYDSQLEKLKTLGLPIYRYRTVSRHRREDVVKGDLIYAGDKEKMARYAASLEAEVRGFEGLVTAPMQLGAKLAEAKTAKEFIDTVYANSFHFHAPSAKEIDEAISKALTSFQALSPTARDYHELQRALAPRPELRRAVMDQAFQRFTTAKDFIALLKAAPDAEVAEREWVGKLAAEKTEAFLALKPDFRELIDFRNAAVRDWPLARRLTLLAMEAARTAKDFMDLTDYPVAQVGADYKAGMDELIQAHLDAFFALKPTMNEIKAFEKGRIRKADAKMAFTKRALPFVKTADDYVKLTSYTFDDPSRKYIQEMEAMVKETVAELAKLSPTAEQLETLLKRFHRLQEPIEHALIEAKRASARNFSPSEIRALTEFPPSASDEYKAAMKEIAEHAASKVLTERNEALLATHTATEFLATAKGEAVSPEALRHFLSLGPSVRELVKFRDELGPRQAEVGPLVTAYVGDSWESIRRGISELGYGLLIRSLLKERPDLYASWLDTIKPYVKNTAELLDVTDPRETPSTLHRLALDQFLAKNLDWVESLGATLEARATLANQRAMGEALKLALYESGVRHAATGTQAALLIKTLLENGTIKGFASAERKSLMEAFLSRKPSVEEINQLVALFPEKGRKESVLVFVLEHLPPGTNIEKLKLPPWLVRGKALRTALAAYRASAGGQTGIWEACLALFQRWSHP